jgi:hypothetical protein
MDGHHLESSYLCISTYLPVKYRLHKEMLKRARLGMCCLCVFTMMPTTLCIYQTFSFPPKIEVLSFII